MEGSTAVVANWSSVARGMVVEAKVTGANANKTGLTVEVNGIKGFMPAREVDLYRTENIEALVNQRLKCEVIEVEPSERNLIVSRRALLERERMRLAEQFWAEVEEGQVRTGTVRNIKPFGAFVDLGSCDGLIPISELSWSRVSDPSEIVKIGQKVEVVVHRLDKDTRKVTLSLRQTIRSPWDDFAEEHKSGSRVQGKVSRIADFGAFVEVAPGVEGLIHVSELSTQRVRRVRDVVQEGKLLEVEVQSIDVQARRMSLSLKSLKAAEEAAVDEAEAAEEAEDRKAAAEKLSARTANPNLRGGVGSGPLIQWPKG
jgi:small subunit ribosomal protein S1